MEQRKFNAFEMGWLRSGNSIQNLLRFYNAGKVVLFRLRNLWSKTFILEVGMSTVKFRLVVGYGYGVFGYVFGM